MLLLQLAVLACLWFASRAHGGHPHHHHRHDDVHEREAFWLHHHHHREARENEPFDGFYCRTLDADPMETMWFQQTMGLYKYMGGGMEGRRHLRNNQNGAFHAEVPTVYYIVTPNGTETVSDQQIEDQHAHLNAAFADAGFVFTREQVNRVTNPDWVKKVARDEDTEMKQSLHVGDLTWLNVYIHTNTGFGGYATLPHGFVFNDVSLDGVVLEDGAVPGGARLANNEGDMLVHEVGHWLNLYHTFQNGCDGPGDYVDDTPYQKTPTGSRACKRANVTIDTCPKQEGTDNEDNYMNYLEDFCHQRFTAGQIERMQWAWEIYRVADAPVCEQRCRLIGQVEGELPAMIEDLPEYEDIDLCIETECTPKAGDSCDDPIDVFDVRPSTKSPMGSKGSKGWHRRLSEESIGLSGREPRTLNGKGSKTGNGKSSSKSGKGSRIYGKSSSRRDFNISITGDTFGPYSVDRERKSCNHDTTLSWRRYYKLDGNGMFTTLTTASDDEKATISVFKQGELGCDAPCLGGNRDVKRKERGTTVTFKALLNETYLIAVHTKKRGTFELGIEFSDDVDPISSCFDPILYSPGCTDLACEELVCAQDEACCTDSWEDKCVLASCRLCSNPPSTPCCDIEVEGTIDHKPEETTWTIVADPDGDAILLGSGGPYEGGDADERGVFFETLSIADEKGMCSGCYKFTLFDYGGDGLDLDRRHYDFFWGVWLVSEWVVQLDTEDKPFTKSEISAKFGNCS